uniref:Uncharacterized protein n=1 Tax=Leersia perrieri TaxID=77586 RepID=A0A0D9WX08_9ORYZ
MASAIVPDMWHWTRSLPNPKHWRGDIYSLQICNSPSTNQSLNLIISWHSETQSFNLSYSICAESLNPISLWSSKYSRLQSANGSDVTVHFLHDIICGVIRYGPYSNKNSTVRLLNVLVSEDSGNIFNLATLTLALIVCIYEAPSTLRRELISMISGQLMRNDMRGAAKMLMLTMGSNMEEQWMRSLNLAVTNWIMETHRLGGTPFLPFTVFSYAVSASKLWKVQLYCPVVTMTMENPVHQTKDEKLLFSLNYQHLEAVIHFICRVTFRENWIDVTVNIDNIRCDLIQLVSETLMAKQGYGPNEKHFPSKISLQLTPLVQTDIISLTVSRSTENPIQEVDNERCLRPRKFKHSVQGNTALLSYSLEGCSDGEMPKLETQSWFRNRYNKQSRPFARGGGGVIVAGDEYGEGVCWRMGTAAAGKTVEWEIKGRIWVTYWPNKKRTLHVETRRVEFREVLRLAIRE